MFLGILLPPVLFLVSGFVIWNVMHQDEALNFRKIPVIWLYGTSSYIIPVVVLNLLVGVEISTITYLHLIFSFLSFLYFVLKGLENLTEYLAERQGVVDIDISWYHIVFAGLAVNTIILQSILPLRGWDALQFYLPNAFYFNLADSLGPGVNGLTFFPLFKAPVNSLLQSYTIYFTTKMDISLVPSIFFISSAILVLNILGKLGMSKEIQYSAASLYLASPFVYIHILEFAYYQDPVLGFYYALAIYYILSSDFTLQDILIIGLSSSMAILSKISGFTILLVILLLYLASLRQKIPYYLLVTTLFAFLIVKTLSSAYLDYLFFLIPIYGLMLVLGQDSDRRIEPLRIASSLSLPITIGIIWLKRLATFPNVLDELYQQYFAVNGLTPQWYHWTAPLSEVFLENSYAVSSISIIFVFFISYTFIPTLVLFKILGLREMLTDHRQYLIWIVSFFSFWLVYHGETSIRYLQPIAIGLFVLIGIGIDKLIRIYPSIANNRLLYLLLILQGPLFYYPFLPFSIVFQPFHARFFLFHKELFKLFAYIGIITVGIMKTAELRLTRKQRQIATRTLIIGIILVPSIGQLGIIATNNFDLEQSRENMVFDHRPEIVELSKFVKNNYDADNDRGVGVNIAGVALFSGVAILDLKIASELPNNSLSLSDSASNEYTQLQQGNITFIITWSQKNPYYTQFQQYIIRYPFLQQPSNATELVYRNNDFLVWTIL